MGGSVHALIDSPESDIPVLFYLWLMPSIALVEKACTLKPEEASTMVVWSGCLSLVPYRLWQVFVLPAAACEYNPTVRPSYRVDGNIL